MIGNAKIQFQPQQVGSKSLIYRNVQLSYRTEEHQALISRTKKDKPEELCCIEGASIDIFAGNLKETVEIQGFIQDKNGKYDPCLATFTPILSKRK